MNYIGVEALSKISVMAHGSSRGSAVNVTKETKHNLFSGIQFLRQTTLNHVQLILLTKRSGIIIVMDNGKSK